MENKLKIICDGDSWVFGSEIVDPELRMKHGKNLHPGVYDWQEENDEYRLPRIFPNHLSELLNADVVNLSWPADDNNTILNRVITHITSNYLSKGLSTENLLVIVGWSSPERNSFWYKDENYSSKFRIWPQNPQVDTEHQKKIWEAYVEFLWNPEEYLPRYVLNVIQFQNFCIANNIKWLCFNSFYQTPNKDVRDWNDLDVVNELKKINIGGYQIGISNSIKRTYQQYEYNSLWETVDQIRFYKKNEKTNTFKSFIESKNVDPIYNGWHPSPNSHKLWAEELVSYINKNKLII